MMLCAGCSVAPAAPAAPVTDPTAISTRSLATPLPTSALPTPASIPTPANQPALNQQLIAAAEAGDLAAVRLLLAQGASVSARDENARTALIAAAYRAHLEVAQVLIDAGADVNVQDLSKQGAYLIATSEIGGSPRALEFLRMTLRAGADVRSLDSYNGTGLIRAADRGFVEIVRELLKTDIAIDHVNRLGWTALLETIILGRGDAQHVEVLRLLVQAGANVNLPDGGGKTPLAHARERGYREMAAMLEAAGAR